MQINSNVYRAWLVKNNKKRFSRFENYYHGKYISSHDVTFVCYSRQKSKHLFTRLLIAPSYITEIRHYTHICSYNLTNLMYRMMFYWVQSR